MAAEMGIGGLNGLVRLWALTKTKIPFTITSVLICAITNCFCLKFYNKVPAKGTLFIDIK